MHCNVNTINTHSATRFGSSWVSSSGRPCIG